MAEKEKKTVRKQQKPKIDKPPTLSERITDTSKGGFIGTPIYTPRKKK